MTITRITNPQAAPVVGCDHQLPSLPPHVLRADELRRRLVQAHLEQPEIRGDGARFGPEREATPAAVLVPLVQRPGGLQVLLTQRAAHLRGHAGQISFPGGRAEPADSGPAATALREAQEEVGLIPNNVEVIGQLPVYTTVTRYAVTPVVGLVQPQASWTLNGFEVAEAFEVPLAFLMNPAHHQRHVFQAADVQRQFLSITWRPSAPPSHTVTALSQREYFIWGATAAMLRNLYSLLALKGGPIIGA